MKPIRTVRSNFVFRGPTADIGDAYCEIVPSETFRGYRDTKLVWSLSDDERAFIAAGGNIELTIVGMWPIPPVAMNCNDDEVLNPDPNFKGIVL